MSRNILVLCISLCLGIHSYAYDFSEKGFYFEKDGTEKTVKIVAGDVPYSGPVVIPSEVSHEGETYVVTSIGQNAFYGCTGLTSITIPNSITLIDMYAFSGCDHLEEVILEDGTSILTTWYDDENYYKGTFSNCPVKRVYQGRNLYSEHYGYTAPAFKEISTLTEVTLSNYVTKLSYNAFSGCSSLEHIVLPESLIVIGPGAFSHCSSLKEIYIPASVKALGEYYQILGEDEITHKNVFDYCPNLEKIVVEYGNAIYDSRSDCNGIVITSANKLLTGCKATVIPQSVTSIEDAFRGCSTLEKFLIPSNITSIGAGAFYDSSLKTIELPSSVNTIGMYAFDTSMGMKLDSITVHWKRPEEVNCDYRAFGGDVYAGDNPQAQLRVPEGSYLFFAQTNPWKNFGIIAEGENYHIRNGHQFTHNGIDYRTIDDSNNLSLCRNDSYEGAIVIPSIIRYKNNDMMVTQLDEWALGVSPALTSIQLPRTLKVIPSNALYACRLLQEVTFETGSQLTEIKGDALKDCTALKSFQMPDGVVSIASGAFTGCSSLESITFPEGLTTLGGMFGVFDGCSSLKEIILPNSLTHLSDFCFGSCSSATHVQLPANITGIGMYTFSFMSSLQSFTALATNPPAVNRDAFAATPIDKAILYVPIGCKDLYANADYWKDFAKIIEVNGQGFRFIKDGIAYEITNAADMEVVVGKSDYSDEVVIPETVSYNDGVYVVLGIDDEAFKNCTQLTSVSISRYITEIGNGVFINCTSLQNVLLPDKLESIGQQAFYGCKGLKNFTIPASVSSIGQEAFAYSSGLESIMAYPIVPPVCGEKAFNGVSKYLCKLYVPRGSKSAYEAADYWKDFKEIIELNDFISGDANGDGLVNVTDIVATVNYIMEKPSEGFNKTAADLNGDGEINVTDIVKMVSIIMSGDSQ